MVKEHLPGYADRDFDVVDYSLYEEPETGLSFRGPFPDFSRVGESVVFLGAAQTFGCLCDRPFPALISERLDKPTLNFGYGGAGPLFYLRHPKLVDLVNQSQLAVIQVMSARSEDNHLFESRGLEFLIRRSDGERLGADRAWRAVAEGEYFSDGGTHKGRIGRAGSRAMSRLRLRLLARETRRNYIGHFVELLEKIRVPKILFWFSRRSPEYTTGSQSLSRLFNRFPQLVDHRTLRKIVPFADDYCECVSQRGIPQQLISRFNGCPVTIDLGRDREEFAGKYWAENKYYPSPEMHEDAAHALIPLIRRYADRIEP